MEQSNSLDKVWHYPEPLDYKIESSMPYPVEAIPSSIQNLVLSYQGYGKQPISLIASTALANLSLSCQALANVARDEFLISPVSLYLIAIAHSGERKSAADSLFSRPVRQWEQTIRQKCEPMLLSALTEHKTWQMERDGLLSKIRRAAFSENDTNGEHYKDLLNRLMQEEPMIPVQPSLYFEDVTAEALSLHLRENWPSAALWSDEAGIIIGSHGMQASPTRFVALLNRLWEDKAFTTHRKTSRSFVLENRRLTLSLMMQPVLFEKLLAHPLKAWD